MSREFEIDVIWNLIYRIPCRVAVGNRSAMVLDQLEAYEAAQESAQGRNFNITLASEMSN